MPVLLDEKDYEPWLSGKAGLELLSLPACPSTTLADLLTPLLVANRFFGNTGIVAAVVER